MDKQRIQELRRRGWNLRRIAQDQGCSYQYTQRVLRDFEPVSIELTRASGGVLVMSAELTQDELIAVLEDHTEDSPGLKRVDSTP